MHAPARIVSLLPSATEIVYALGLGESVIGVSHECDYPSAAREKPRLTCSQIDSSRTSEDIDRQVKTWIRSGRPLYDLDWDQLRRLQPDLIITQQQCNVCAMDYESIRQAVTSSPELHSTKLLALSARTLRDVLQDVLLVGEATNRSREAAEYVTHLQRRIDAVSGRSSGLLSHERPRIACIEWIQPLMLASNWMPELVEIAGGTNVISQGGIQSGYSEWGALIDAAPDVCVIMPCGFDLIRTTEELAPMLSMPGWEGLPAVRSGRVYAVDGNAYFNRSGPRLVDSLEILEQLIHPHRFSSVFSPDMVRRIAE